MITKANEAKRAFNDVHDRCSDVLACIDEFKQTLVDKLDKGRGSDKIQFIHADHNNGNGKQKS